MTSDAEPLALTGVVVAEILQASRDVSRIFPVGDDRGRIGVLRATCGEAPASRQAEARIGCSRLHCTVCG